MNASHLAMEEGERIVRHNSVTSLDSWDTVLDDPSEAMIGNTVPKTRVNASSFTQISKSNGASANMLLSGVYHPDSTKTFHSSFVHVENKKMANGSLRRVPLEREALREGRNSSNVVRNKEKPKTDPHYQKERNKLIAKVQNGSPTVSKPSFTQTATPIMPLFHLERPQVVRKSSTLPSKAQPPELMSDSSPDQTEKMKTKLMSVWNNMKYGWSVPTKTSFSFLSPIFFLGESYHDVNAVSHSPQSSPVDSPIEKFKLDFSSRIWLTYRRDFPAFSGTNFTTDCGWGCMLRSGQMMLAQALVSHFLGRGWRCSGVPQTEKSLTLHRTIIKWFADSLSNMCPLSLHHLVEIGRTSGKKAGDWFGPASVAHILKQAVENASKTSPLLDKICVYVAQDCTVYEEDVISLCTSPSHLSKIPESCRSPPTTSFRFQRASYIYPDPEEHISWSEAAVADSPPSYSPPVRPDPWQLSRNKWIGPYQSPPLSPISRTWSNPTINTSNGPPPSPTVQVSVPSGVEEEMSSDRWRGLVILVPVRLGGEKLNPIYVSCLKRLLAHESSIGIIGGKPRHALFFVGYQDDKLIHLDPHYCQETVDIRPHDFPVNSFHCTVPKKIPIMKMDPSCTIGFYLRTRDDFDRFMANISPLLLPSEPRLEYPIFVVSKGSSSSLAYPWTPKRSYENETTEGEYLNCDSDLESENFVLL